MVRVMSNTRFFLTWTIHSKRTSMATFALGLALSLTNDRFLFSICVVSGFVPVTKHDWRQKR